MIQITSYFDAEPKRFLQLHRVINLTVSDVEGDTKFVELNTADNLDDLKALATGKDLSNGILITNVELLSASCFGTVIQVPTFEKQIVQAVANLIDVPNWFIVHLVSCDSVKCNSFQEYFEELAGEKNIHLLSNRAVFEEDLATSQFNLESSMITVVYGEPSFLRKFLMRMETLLFNSIYSDEYQSELDSLPSRTFILATSSTCESIFETSDDCGSDCISSLMKNFKGLLCVEREKIVDTEWLEKVWNPATSVQALTSDEILFSSLLGWNDSNMDSFVPVTADIIKWSLSALVKECSTSTSTSIDFSSCVQSIASNSTLLESTISSFEFNEGMVVKNPQTTLSMEYKFLAGLIGWSTFATINEDTKQNLSLADLESITWNGGSTEVPECSYLKPIDPTFEFVGVSMFVLTLVLMAFSVCVLAFRKKNRFFLGILSKSDCMAIYFIATLGLTGSLFSGVLAPFISEGLTKPFCTLPYLYPAVRMALIFYLVLSIRDYRAVFLNRTLKVSSRLKTRWKLAGVTLLFALNVLFNVLYHIYKDASWGIAYFQNQDKPVELFETCYSGIKFLVDSNEIKGTRDIYIIGELVGIVYLVWGLGSLLTKANKSMVRSKRLPFLKTLRKFYIISLSLGILYALAGTSMPICEVFDDERLIIVCEDFSSFTAVGPSSLFFYAFQVCVLVLSTVWAEMLFITFKDRRLESSKKKLALTLVPKALFTDETGSSTAANWLKNQKAQTPMVIMHMVGQDHHNNNNNNNLTEDQTGDMSTTFAGSRRNLSIHITQLLSTEDIHNTTEIAEQNDPKSQTQKYMDDISEFEMAFLQLNEDESYNVLGMLREKVRGYQKEWVKERMAIKVLNRKLEDLLERNDIIVVRSRRVIKNKSKDQNKVSPIIKF